MVDFRTAALAGDNQPPPTTEYDKIREDVLVLCGKVTKLEGYVVDTQAKADHVSGLLNKLRNLANRGEAARKKELAPIDTVRSEIQRRYNSLFADLKSQKGTATLAIGACKELLEPFLRRVREEKQRKEEEARKAAEEAQRQAREAVQASHGNLEARAEAETLVQEARMADRQAKVAARDRAQAHGGGRTTTLRTTYRPLLKDAKAAASHYWKTRRVEMEAWLVSMAQTDVAHGKRDIPGFDIIEEQQVV